MLDLLLAPSAPGFYAEWPTLVGAATAWEAARAHDAAYVQSGGAAGQRISFPVELPEIRSDDTVTVAMRAYLARPTLQLLLDPGFESGVNWFLDDNGCTIMGAFIDGTNPHTGTKQLKLNSQTLGPTCGGVETVLGIPTMGQDLVPGLTYGIDLWHDTPGGVAAPRRTSVRIEAFEIGAMTGNSAGPPPNTYTRVGFGFGAGSGNLPGSWTFLAPAVNRTLRLDQPSGAGAVLFSRWLDDLFLQKVDAATVTPFYRIFGQDFDLAPWVLARGAVAQVLQTDRSIPVFGYMLRDGAFEFGVRAENGVEVQLDQLQLSLQIVKRLEGQGFVGSRYS